jgi:M6 family metalloprotease-like protein
MNGGLPGSRSSWGWAGFVVAVGSVMACVSARPAHAVSARPGTIVAVQPDGAKVSICLRGDEHAHWVEDAAGYPITKSPQSGQWVYAVVVDGAVKATDLVVGRDNPQGLEPLKDARGQVRAAAKARRTAKLAGQKAPSAPAPKGTMRNLVILVNFTDTTISNTPQEFDDLFNQAGYAIDGAVGSVRDYYLEVSYGALTIESTVVEPVTLDHTYAYYGQNDAWGEDLLPSSMVRDAVVKLKGRGFDFSQMDGDGDGYVDGLTVVHAGQGEEEGTDANGIWSHKGRLGNPMTYDGVILSAYCSVPASRAGGGIIRIGTICHELGHILGLPDLYDTTYKSKGVGDFCLMGGGSWNGDAGACPAHPSAWCKIALHWVQPTVIATAGHYSLSRVETTPQICRLQGAFAANEYFLIENRQGTGFDAQLPGTNHGILIWHVDANQPDNDDAAHYMVDLEEAGSNEPNRPAQHLEKNENGGEDSDYFRQGHAPEFTDKTDPGSLSYGGAKLGLGIKNIGPSDATMTFDVKVIDPLSISGFIRTGDGAGIDGVLVTEDKDGGWDMTDTNGYYKVPVRLGWSGTIALTKAGYSFDPDSRSYENVRADISLQNYTGVQDGGGSGVGVLSVTTVDPNGQPLGGGIYVDSVLKGNGSWSDYVAAGTHLITFGPLDGYTEPQGQLVNVPDAQSVSVTGTYTIGQAASAFPVTATATPVDADHEPNAVKGGIRVTAQASGGTPPYAYEWNTGVKWPSFVVVPTDTVTYSVTVTDSKGATGLGTVTVTASLTVSAQAAPEVVSDGQRSTLTATASGGVQPYAYSWSTGETGASITVAPTQATEYTVSATDASGQTATATVTVFTPQVQSEVQVAAPPCLVPIAAVGLLTGCLALRTLGGRNPRRRT